jgi:hypothetical protein
MKRANKKNIAAAAVLLVLFGLTQLFCALRLQSLTRGVPHAAVLDSPRGIGITMKQALAFADASSFSAVALGVWQYGTLSVPSGASEPAYTAYATPGAGICLPGTYAFGNWFLPGNDITPCAVLPEALSLKLFGTNRPEGAAVLAGQTEYKVCGVYREGKSFLHRLSGDGMPRVYLYDPLRMAGIPAAALYLTDAKGSDSQYLQHQAAGLQKTTLIGSLTDYRPRLGLTGSLWYVSFLACIFFASALFLLAAARQLIAAASAQKETGKKRLARLTIGAAVTAAVWFALSALLDHLAVPPSYLPQDNVFELSFYVKAVESFFASLHAPGATTYDWVFLTHILSVLLWSLLGLALFIPAALKLRRIFKELRPPWKSAAS